MTDFSHVDLGTQRKTSCSDRLPLHFPVSAAQCRETKDGRRLYRPLSESRPVEVQMEEAADQDGVGTAGRREHRVVPHVCIFTHTRGFVHEIYVMVLASVSNDGSASK